MITNTPITWGATAINTEWLEPLAQANAGTQFAFAAGSLIGWGIYRWFYLPARTSWVDIIPDKIRRLFGIYTDQLDITQQYERNFYTRRHEEKVAAITDRQRNLRKPINELYGNSNQQPPQNQNNQQQPYQQFNFNN